MTIAELRHQYHRQICENIVRVQPAKSGVDAPNFADIDSKASVMIACGILQRMQCEAISSGSLKEQTAGKRFEQYTQVFLESAFEQIKHLRPGDWTFRRERTDISNFDQYEHLSKIAVIVKNHAALATVLGRDYIVKPDIIVARSAITKESLVKTNDILGIEDGLASLTPLIQENSETQPHYILHASISCKWTLRSDRSQNARTEALNLIRNRKGNLPHIVAVTAEPLPTRLATLALGTGDLDCVYHFALHEMVDTLKDIGNEDQLDMLNTLVEGRRLRDISDLPFDLAI